MNCNGSVAAEFALIVPTIVLIAAGIADFGLLAATTAELAGTTRIGAAYARLHPLDTNGIQNSMRNASILATALVFPTAFPQSCECDDETPIACSQSCSAVGRPGPNRRFIRVSASLAFTPLVPWPGLPATLTATAEVRLQ